MFYCVPLFLVKLVFYIKFMASLLPIPLITQRWLELLMFEIAILLRFIGIINEPWYLLQTFVYLILVLVLHQELRYLYFYYEYAQTSSCQLQKQWHFSHASSCTRKFWPRVKFYVVATILVFMWISILKYIISKYSNK